MRLRTTTLLLILGLCATAAAAPDQKRSDESTPSLDDMHVTVTAGRGRLGLAVIEIGDQLRTHFGAPADRGVLVDRVRPDSPAAKAGLQVGDVIVELDGAAAHSVSDMLDAIGDRKQGDHVSIAAIRDGKQIQLTATLDDDPGPRWQAFGGVEKGLPRSFGWDFGSFEKAMPKELRRFFESAKTGDADLERQLEQARERIESLEHRLDKLDHT